MTAPAWFSGVNNVFATEGVPTSIWESIAGAESGLNPSAVGRHSVGLFQLNRYTGQGRGYSVQQLENPLLNASIASKYIAPAYQQGLSEGFSGAALAQYTATHSGHPGGTLTSFPTSILPPAGSVSNRALADYQKETKNIRHWFDSKVTHTKGSVWENVLRSIHGIEQQQFISNTPGPFQFPIPNFGKLAFTAVGLLLGLIIIGVGVLSLVSPNTSAGGMGGMSDVDIAASEAAGTAGEMLL